MTLCELIRGPLFWLAFGVFVSGMVTRVALFMATSRKKLEVALALRHSLDHLEGGDRDRVRQAQGALVVVRGDDVAKTTHG